MKHREVLGTVKFDTRKATADQGHEYGAGRPTQKHRKPQDKRAKDKLRKELREW